MEDIKIKQKPENQSKIEIESLIDFKDADLENPKFDILQSNKELYSRGLGGYIKELNYDDKKD